MHAARGHKTPVCGFAEHMGEEDWLIDPLAWGEWYAGRTLYKTASCHGTPEYVWVIVEKGKESPHSRLPQWGDAKRLTEGREPFYRWPENSPVNGPAVEVHRLRYREYLRLCPLPPNAVTGIGAGQ